MMFMTCSNAGTPSGSDLNGASLLTLFSKFPVELQQTVNAEYNCRIIANDALW